MTISSNKKTTVTDQSTVSQKAQAPKLVVDNSNSIHEEINENAVLDRKKENTLDKADVKEEVKKEPVKKATRKKGSAESKKTTSKRTYTRRKNIPTSVVLQYQSVEVESETLISKVKEMWVNVHGNLEKDIKKINLYIKPEEYSAYYVVNDNVNGKIDL